MSDNLGEIIIYQTDDGLTKIETKFEQDTVWLSLDQMAELFQRDKSTVSRHIKNVFDEGELERDSVVANFATTASDGKTYKVDHYNLDVIISVGYRVKSLRGTQFRRWATERLKEYMIKGFTMDDERLKAELESEVPVCKSKSLLRISFARVNSGIMKERTKIRSYNSKLEVTIPKWNLQNQID